MSGTITAATLARLPLFKGVPDDVLRRLAETASIVKPADGSQLFTQGDPPAAAFIILEGSGRVRVGAPDAAAKRLMVEVFRAGDLFGEMGVLDGAPRSADAAVLGDVRLLRIEGATFRAAAESCAPLALNLARLLAARLRRTFGLLQDATFAPLEVRLARQVLYIARTDGIPTSAGVRLGGRFRQPDLADLLGATTRSIITILNNWRAADLVAYDTDKAFLTVRDMARLEALANRAPEE
ncbi:MAG TPA: Crp/Fnr family transcriptional regulator [Acetobacteraceae bacterium]|nr:Crp/Fnr family transcriptional regulator [Acetobacteraceae bacterium]